MSKKDYISDNLITIRDRLRESAAAMHEKSVQDAAANPPSVPEQTAASAAPVPDSASARRLEEGLRAKQDLTGRILRDLAMLEQQESDAARLAGLRQNLRENLQKLQLELQRLTPAEKQGTFAAETDRLRMEYFRLLGTLEALNPANPQAAGTPSSAELSQAQTPSVGAWIVAGAVLAGAALIAGVTAAIFH